MLSTLKRILIFFLHGGGYEEVVFFLPLILFFTALQAYGADLETRVRQLEETILKQQVLIETQQSEINQLKKQPHPARTETSDGPGEKGPAGPPGGSPSAHPPRTGRPGLCAQKEIRRPLETLGGLFRPGREIRAGYFPDRRRVLRQPEPG